MHITIFFYDSSFRLTMTLNYITCCFLTLTNLLLVISTFDCQYCLPCKWFLVCCNDICYDMSYCGNSQPSLNKQRKYKQHQHPPPCWLVDRGKGVLFCWSAVCVKYKVHIALLRKYITNNPIMKRIINFIYHHILGDFINIIQSNNLHTLWKITDIAANHFVPGSYNMSNVWSTVHWSYSTFSVSQSSRLPRLKLKLQLNKQIISFL